MAIMVRSVAAPTRSATRGRRGTRAPSPDSARGIDPSKKISLYVQMANVLRHNILSGRWPPGHLLPSMDVLATSHGVARVTVRQAVNMLVGEGLLESWRGRGTFVRASQTAPAQPLRDPINNMLADKDDFDIRILSKSRVTAISAELAAGVSVLPRYVEIRKLHIHNRRPFALTHICVAEDYFKLLPRGGEKEKKIARLLQEYAPGALQWLYQTMTVEPAGIELSEQLDYAFAAPVARVVRRFVDRDNRLIYAGVAWYRGDTFIMDMKLPNEWVHAYPAAVAPTPRERELGAPAAAAARRGKTAAPAKPRKR